MSMEVVINPKKKSEQTANPKKKKKKGKSIRVKEMKIGKKKVMVLYDNPEYKVSITKIRKKKNPSRRGGLIAFTMKDITSANGLIWVAGGYAVNRFGSGKVAEMVGNLPLIGTITDKLGEKAIIPLGSLGVSLFMKGQMRKNLQLMAVGSGIDWILSKFLSPAGTTEGVEGTEYAPVYGNDVGTATSKFVNNVNNAVNSVGEALAGLNI